VNIACQIISPGFNISNNLNDGEEEPKERKENDEGKQGVDD
jgi:hypothetical protein